MAGARILIIDDDVNICEMLRLYLESEGYDVRIANDGVVGFYMFNNYDPDIVLLDIMLPSKDGWEVCRQIRKHSNKPIIMITAKGETYDKVLGLELGADDFVVKPFDMKELSARVKAVLRRSINPEDSDSNETVVIDNIEINKNKYELKLNGKMIEITSKELHLIHFLASNYNNVFTRDQLLNKVWGYDYVGDSRTVDVHIKKLRQKLDGASDKWSLKTIWGVGYMFEVTDN